MTRAILARPETPFNTMRAHIWRRGGVPPLVSGHQTAARQGAHDRRFARAQDERRADRETLAEACAAETFIEEPRP